MHVFPYDYYMAIRSNHIVLLWILYVYMYRTVSYNFTILLLTLQQLAYWSHDVIRARGLKEAEQTSHRGWFCSEN